MNVAGFLVFLCLFFIVGLAVCIFGFHAICWVFAWLDAHLFGSRDEDCDYFDDTE